MGHFYNPPPPAHGRVNSTPPLPHDPIPAQGDQPPRRQVGAVLAMVAVLASWPADQEPRLQPPNNQQQKIAPLTLPTGQQPPRFSLANRMAQAVASWPADLEPRLGRPNEQQQKIAPLTLTYGTAPLPHPFLGVQTLQLLVASWPPDSPLPPRGQSSVFPGIVVAPPYVPNPMAGRIYPAILSAVLEDAAADVELVATYTIAPENPDPAPLRQAIPLVQRIAGMWVQAWDAQSAPKSTAWYVPSTFTPHTSPPALIWSAWADPLPLPVRPVPIATLTLATGQAPPPQSPLSSTTLRQIASAWVQTWDAQTAPKNAGWNVPPILISLPYVPRQAHLWTAWEPPPPLPIRPAVLAPLTLTYGQQPPRQSALSVQKLGQMAQVWTLTWDTQTLVKEAAWYVAPLPSAQPDIFRGTVYIQQLAAWDSAITRTASGTVYVQQTLSTDTEQ